MTGAVFKDDERWMLAALATARQAELIAPPNPAVGCVIVRDGLELARGFTQRPGGHHAEIEAIEAAERAGYSVQGATVYVTLEPCSHTGRTPPCALRLIEKKVGRVVFAIEDPNPQVAGRGARMLTQAGIAVTSGVCRTQAWESNRGFLTRMQRGTPWVRMKIATSLDGRTALPNGQSCWITSMPAREDGHRLRAQAQGILTGIGTVLADDPQMSVRLPGDWPQPVKFVLDSQARLPLTAKIIQGAPCTVFVGDSADPSRVNALRERGLTVIAVGQTQTGRLDLHAVLDAIGRCQINVLHVEAGAVVNGALLTAGLVDEVVVYTSACFMGPGRPAAILPELTHMSDVVRWKIAGSDCVGEDLRLTLRRPH